MLELRYGGREGEENLTLLNISLILGWGDGSVRDMLVQFQSPLLTSTGTRHTHGAQKCTQQTHADNKP